MLSVFTCISLNFDAVIYAKLCFLCEAWLLQSYLSVAIHEFNMHLYSEKIVPEITSVLQSDMKPKLCSRHWQHSSVRGCVPILACTGDSLCRQLRRQPETASSSSTNGKCLKPSGRSMEHASAMWCHLEMTKKNWEKHTLFLYFNSLHVQSYENTMWLTLRT